MAPQLSEDSLESLPDRIGGTFSGQNVLISGGTGFMGKVLVEKLLRKCPDINEILLLVRPKKGKTPQERLHVMFADPLFETVITKSGGVEPLVSKMKIVSADMQEPDLALSPEDREYIVDNVTMIVHAAATIRFDEMLKKAVLLNVRGTKLMLELGKDCKKLKIFVHISTAYCHLHEKLLEEQAYPPPADPHKVIAAAELFDDVTLETMADRFLTTYPNSYAYTKACGEALAVEFMQYMPVMVLRPSIVIPIIWEPLPGWTDNINGPTGLLIGAGKGVLRSMYCRSDSYADYLPVDVFINGIMVSVWNYLNNGDTANPILNLTSSAEVKVTWHELIETGRSIILNKVPLNGVAWYPGGSMKHNRLQHQICCLLYHWIPAMLVDSLLWLLRYEPVLMRVHRRINKGFEVFEYYTNNQWDFKSDKGQMIRKKLNEREHKEYKVDAEGADIPQYFEDCVVAARRYILKEPDDTIPAAKRHMKVMWFVDKVFTLFFYGLLLWYFLKWTGLFGFGTPSSTLDAMAHTDRAIEL
ncbi:hypothetical protein O0L34_g14963 [Tuta absoluta]|nr:hypothetical protein O0L34_g14963 [Tuta absoluta]